MNSNFFIKPGYIANEVNLTWEETPQDYWTTGRLASSLVFQYYVYEAAATLFKDRQMKSFMDVGCGPGTKVKHFFSSLTDDIIVVDQPTLKELVHQQLGDVTFIGADLGEIDLELDEAKDMIICADVVEHLINPDACMTYIHRSLNKGGIAIISTPERDYLRGRDCNECTKPSHVREWNSAEFTKYVESHGFKIIRHVCYPQAHRESSLFQLARQTPKILWQNIPFLAKRLGGCQAVICTV